MIENILIIITLVLGYFSFNFLVESQVPNALSIVFIAFLILTGLCALWRIKNRNVHSFVGFLASNFKLLLVIVLFRMFLFEPMQVPSGSMEPTMRVGDFIAVNKYRYGIKDPIFQKTLIEMGHPKAGDIVVFKAPKHPWQDYVKRVVGVGGDIIEFDLQNRTLTVTHDGKKKEYSYENIGFNPDYFYYGNAQFERVESGAVTHHILNNNFPLNIAPYYFKQEGQPVGRWVVPENHYFMMGDNRDNSEDSRFWGFVSEQAIVGQAVSVIFSLDKKANQYPTGVRFDRTFKELN